MPIDFAHARTSLTYFRQSLNHTIDILVDIENLDWRGVAHAHYQAVGITTPDYADFVHNLRVARRHFGEPLKHRSIYNDRHDEDLPGHTGRAVWSLHGSYASPIEIIFAFDADNPPDWLSDDGKCGFVEAQTEPRWGCRVGGAS